MTPTQACERCLARTWLIGALSGHLETVRHHLFDLLGLENQMLLEAVAGREALRLADELRQFDPSGAHAQAARAGLETICSCSPAYPQRLRELTAPPAVLHVAGGLERLLAFAAGDTVAVVGSRRPTSYGLDVARSLCRGIAVSGLTVLSGMAFGIDAAAHEAALSAGGSTLAVLPAGSERPYPAAHRQLFRRLASAGAVISELPAGSAVRRWTFLARNRIIAALAGTTVVVEAGSRSGALVTARLARELERPVGAVPGRVTSPQALGPNELLAGGAYVVRDAQDVLDQLFGAGVRTAGGCAGRQSLEPELARLLAALAEGEPAASALARAGIDSGEGAAALARLELEGYIRREAAGRFAVLP